jgi:hypothetical protein
MKTIVTAVGIGAWYPRGIARLKESLEKFNPEVETLFFVDEYPPGAPGPVIQDGYDYGPYCAKPFALQAALDAGADTAILIDAAFYAVRSIQPLVDYIADTGYYLCNNGFTVGQWCSDRAAKEMGFARDYLLDLPEASSYCVGVSGKDPQARAMARAWVRYAKNGNVFPGPHTALHCEGRNKGFVSFDVRVLGHRHDQTALNFAAYLHGRTKFVDRPWFTSYKAGFGGHTDKTTVFENEGMGS